MIPGYTYSNHILKKWKSLRELLAILHGYYSNSSHIQYEDKYIKVYICCKSLKEN